MQQDLTTETPPAAPAGDKRIRLGHVLTGLVLGALIGLGLSELGVPRIGEHAVAIGAGVGALLSLWRVSWRLMWVIAAGIVVLYLMMCYTPLAEHLFRGMTPPDSAESAPAVVVLGSGAFRDQTLASGTQDRALRAYSILREGRAGRLVVTRPLDAAQPWDEIIRRQMQERGLAQPVDVVGPVVDTHDEAMRTAELARREGWKSVIVVTHSWHMRRAAAVFEKAGIHAIVTSAADSTFDHVSFEHPSDRRHAFKLWVRETVGYTVYRMRGWAD